MKNLLWCSFLLGLALLAQAGSPPLIPQPQRVEWTGGRLDCAHYQLVTPAGAEFAARELDRVLPGARRAEGGTPITLRLQSLDTTNREAYALEVTPAGIVLTAPQPAGLIYGVSTLRQLFAGTTSLPCCHLTDWPAFPLRGFMHDTGRNFQTLASLEDQLDRFADYKLNVFHWHLTDNPAWRIECKVFPALNDPKFQTRDQGCSYTYADIRAFIQYARDRNITILPELDMPGHSAVFERALGFKMGSKQGMAALERIIDEFCREIPAADCPWLHLGSDEVHVPNPAQFMARMLAKARANGRVAWVWHPGLPGDEHTVQQFWLERGAAQFEQSTSPYVDSAGGYLNWYDPLAVVQRFYFRQPCGRSAGDDRALGSILCCWPDVRVADKVNIFRYNAVWPGMLAFAEAVWHGVAANRPQYFAALPSRGTPAWSEFREFERRLAFHRDHYFSRQPFPFVQTAAIEWQVIGPFYRGSNAAPETAFAPETALQPSYSAGGRALAWQPVTGGAITELEDRLDVDKKRLAQATAYAYTRIHSATEQDIRAWIGFETPTRSSRQCGGIPPACQWSPFGAAVWINGAPAPAPRWQQPGQNQYLRPTWFSPANEIPYTDEEFYWTREPATLHLKAGWSQVLLRVPCGYAVQKWGFTFIPVQWEPAAGRWVENESVAFSNAWPTPSK